MSKLNPALRTGLIWAGTHQVATLCVMVMVGIETQTPLIDTIGLPLVLLDFPAIGLAVLLHLFELLTSIARAWPSLHSIIDSPFQIFLLLGALQWFAIGYVVGVRRSKREAQQAL